MQAVSCTSFLHVLQQAVDVISSFTVSTTTAPFISEVKLFTLNGTPLNRKHYRHNLNNAYKTASIQ